MITGQPYFDRRAAGQILASHIREQFDRGEATVLALPRGGVPVGFEVARAIDAPLDVFLVRKLGFPRQPELAMGAIATGGYEVLDENLIAQLGVTPLQVADVADRETAELRRREELYRAGRPPLDVEGRVVYLVDDGLATGSTMRAAIGALRDYGVRRLIVAVPVGADDTCAEIARHVDAVICPFVPNPFHAVGLWYKNFEPTSDHDVQECLAAAALNHEAA
ncbi:MAG: phosphoribosyltransferase [Opitutaceae bacterium]